MTKKFILISLLSLILAGLTTVSVMAVCREGEVETSLMGCVSTADGSCSVFMILNIILYVLTAGVGIVAMAGVIVAGVQYATAGDSDQRVVAAKGRIKNIVIGLVLWVNLAALSQWLLPGGVFNSSSSCKTVIASVSTARSSSTSKTATKNKVGNTTSKNNSKTKKNNKTTKKNTNSKKTRTNEEARELLNQTALDLAWPRSQKSKSTSSATAAFTKAMKATKSNAGKKGCRSTGKACGMFVGTVVRYSGINKNFPTTAYSICKYMREHPKIWKDVTGQKYQGGDILCYFDRGTWTGSHIGMVVKTKNGKIVSAQASLCDWYGRVEGKIYTDHRRIGVYRYMGK